MSQDLASLPDSEITARLYQLRQHERQLLVETLRYIGEVDRRKLYAPAGHSSLFAMLTRFYGYSGGAAFPRCTAARLLARFPVVADYLGDGRLNLTTLCELRDVLDEERLDEILQRAAGRSEDEVKRVVAALRPRPPVPDLLRRVPTPPTSPPVVPAAAPTQAPEPAAVPPATPRAHVEPLSATQHVLRATVSGEFVSDLEAVRAALGHKLPGAGLEAILHECLRVTLGVYSKRRRGAGRAPATPAANDNANGRHIPTAVRNAVWERDGGCCAFVAADGTRCGTTTRLEFHHIVPFACGGAATVANLALRCASHNAYEARRDFGAEHVDAAILRTRARRQSTVRQGSLF